MGLDSHIIGRSLSRQIKRIVKLIGQSGRLSEWILLLNDWMNTNERTKLLGLDQITYRPIVYSDK